MVWTQIQIIYEKIYEHPYFKKETITKKLLSYVSVSRLFSHAHNLSCFHNETCIYLRNKRNSPYLFINI